MVHGNYSSLAARATHAARATEGARLRPTHANHARQTPRDARRTVGAVRRRPRIARGGTLATRARGLARFGTASRRLESGWGWRWSAQVHSMGVDIGVKLLHGHGVRQRCYAPVRIPAARAGGVARRRAVSQMTLMGDTILAEPKVGRRSPSPAQHGLGRGSAQSHLWAQRY